MATEQEIPLILVLAKFLLRLVGYLCVLGTLPVWLWSALVVKFGKNKIFDKPSIGYIVLFIPRILITFLFAMIVFSVFSAPITVLQWIFEGEATTFWITVLSCLVSILSFLYANSFRISNPRVRALLPYTDWSFFGDVVRETLLDIVNILFFALSISTLIRIPGYFVHPKSTTRGRSIIALNFIYAVIDLFLLPCLIILLPFVWRSKVALRHAKSLSDILWSGDLRRAILNQLIEVLLDIFFSAVALVVFCSIYRIKPLLSAIFQNRPGARKRVADQFGLLILDVIIVVPLIVVCLTGYRVPSLRRDLQRGWPQISMSSSMFHTAVLAQFGEILVDLLFAIFGVVVILLVWRSIFLIHDLYKAQTAAARRELCITHFSMLFVDVLDIPVVVLVLVMVVTLWRALPLWESIKKGTTRKQRRMAVITNFRDWLLDIVCAVLTAFIFLTLIRARRLYVGLKQFANTPVAVVRRKGIDEDEDPTPNMQRTWRDIVFSEFLQLIQDIPLYLLALLTLWRFPILVYRLAKECEDDRERRAMIVRYIFLVVKDIPAFVFLAIMISTLWRIPCLYQAYKKYQRGDSEHQIIQEEFFQWIEDIPYAILSVIPLSCPWRVFSFIYEIYKTEDHKARRELCVTYATIVFYDVLVAALTLIVFGTVIRIYTWIKYLVAKRTPKGNLETKFPLSFRIYNATTEAVTDVMYDVVTILFVVIIWALVVKIPAFLKRAYQLSVAMWKNDYASHKELQGINRAVFGINYYIFVAGKFAVDSLRLVPEIIFIWPFKILAIPLVPVYYYSKWRFSKPESDEWHSSVFEKVIYSLKKDAHRDFNLSFFHYVFFRSAAILVCTICHELSIIIALLNIDLMFLITIGSPLWSTQAKKLPRGVKKGIRMVMNWIQIILSPAIALYMIVAAFLPPLAYLIHRYPLHKIFSYTILHEVDFLASLAVHYLKEIISIFDGAQAIYPRIHELALFCLNYLQQYDALALQLKVWPYLISYTWGLVFKAVCYGLGNLSYHVILVVVVISLMWFHVVTAGFRSAMEFAKRSIEYFGVIAALRWWIEGIIAGRMWRTYKILLTAPTAWCYNHRKTFFIGEILMFPLFAAWTGMPMLVTYKFSKPIYCILASPASIYLAFIATDIISSCWQNIESSMEQHPVLKINKAFVRFEKYGFVLTLHCKKPADFTIQQCRLHILGDLWKILGKIMNSTTVSMFRYTFHPILLCDTFFKASVFQPHSEEVIIPVEFGSQGWYKINSTYVLKPKLKNLVDKFNNPTIELFVEYGTKQLIGWKAAGVLVRFKFTVADMLSAAFSLTELKIDTMES